MESEITTPIKKQIELIRNYGEISMKQVEVLTNAPSNIDMDILNQMIDEQKLSSYDGPSQPLTYKRAPKAAYHPRGHEPIKIDKSSVESASFWASFVKIPPQKKITTPTTKPSTAPTIHTNSSLMTYLLLHYDI